MTVAQHIPEDDLALFALALMQPEEAAFTLAHLKHCDFCRDEVARLQGTLVTYAMSADMQEPPADSRGRLLTAVAKEKKLFPAQPAAEPVLAQRNSNLLDMPKRYESLNRGPGVAGWMGWAVAAALAATVGWQYLQGEDLHRQLDTQTATLQQQRQKAQTPSPESARAQEVLRTLTDPAAMQVALHLPATPGSTLKPEGHAAYNAEKGSLVFIGSHMRPIEPGKTYELWLLPAVGKTPVPAGLFRPDLNGNASVLLPSLPKNIAAKGFGVTVEDDGGAPAPTPPIVLAGA